MDVTVVVPMHNAQATVIKTLESIQAQTQPVTRILVVDDKSTDDSVQIVRQAGLANLEVISLAGNVGPAATRNTGARQAVTEWLAFLDADDVWAPEFLASVCAAIERFGADFGSSGGIRRLSYRGDGSTFRRVLEGAPDALDLTDAFWRTALKFMPIHPSSAVVRRDLFNATHGYCEGARNGEDVPLWAELWRHGRFAFVNAALFTSVAPPTGLSAGRIRYTDVYVPLRSVAGTLLRSLRARKRGSGWFLVWFAAAVVRRNGTWLVRRLRRRSR